MFNQPLTIDQGITTVFDQNGMRLTASCLGGNLKLFVTPESTGTDNVVEDTVFDNLAAKTSYVSDFSVVGNTQVDVLAGNAGSDDYNGLLTVRTYPAGQLTFIQWWASGGNNHPQGTCLVGGTASY